MELYEKYLNEEYVVKFSEDKALWNLVKKYWPNETKQLEKGYDEKLMNTLKDNVMGSISRYGFNKFQYSKIKPKR